MKKKLAAAISVVLILSVLAAVPFNSTAAGGKEFVYPNTYDFSEMNMASNCSSAAPDGFDYTEGGNTQMSTAYLASWDGAVSEFADPYSDSYDYKEIESSFHIRDVVYLDRTNIKEIKAAVMEYGAVSVAFLFSANHLKWDGEGSRAAYYFPAGISVDAMAENDVAGHGVTIIGWDDNFSVENFNDKPLGNGAFLCKNSWDSSFGEEGFFYLSYYDNCFSGISLYGIADIAGMTPGTAVYTAPEINVEYNKIYQYDPLGSVSQFSSAINRIDYVANVFPEKGSTLAADETLHAVSFYTHDTNMKYDICIVDGYVSKSELARRIAGNDFACVQSGTAAEMGYHTFDLEQPVQLKAGTRFAVVVRLKTNLGRRAGFGCEYPMNNFASSKVRAGYEESLYYCNGICYDLTNELENANWCLKAFTKASVCASDGNSAGVLNGVNASRRPMSDKTYSPLQAVALGAKISESFLAYASNKGRGIAGVVPDSNIFYGSDEVLSLGKSLPESYDLRDYGRVSPVRNQGNLGSCWAHAAYASLESCMLKEYGAQGVDFFNGAAVSIGQNANEQTVELAAGGEYIISYKPIQKENIMYAKIQSDKKLECEIISEYGVVMHMLAGKSIEITEDMMVVGERRYLRIRFADPGAAGSFKFVPQMLRDVYYPFETAAKIVRGGAASPADPAAEEAVFSFDMSPNGGEAHFCFTSLTKSDCFVRVCDKDGITIPDYYYDQAFTSCGARSLTVYPRETGENETLYIYVRGGGSFTLNYAVGEAERDAIVLTERMKAAKAYAGSAGIIVENGEPLMFSFVPGRDGSYIPLISGYDTGFFDAGFGVYDSTGAKHTDFYVDALGNTTTFAKLRAGNKYFISIDGSDFENQEVTMLEYSAVPPKTDITIDEDGYAGYSFFTMGQTVCTSFSPPESGKYEVSVWEKVGMVIKDGDGGVVLDGAVDECCEVSLEKGKTYAIEIKNIEGYCSSFAYILIRLVVEPVNIELKPGKRRTSAMTEAKKLSPSRPRETATSFSRLIMMMTIARICFSMMGIMSITVACSWFPAVRLQTAVS